VNPATQHKLGVEHSATKKEVEECVKRAQIAQRVWAKTSFEERRAVLRDFIETVLCNQEDICVASMNDTGKTRSLIIFMISVGISLMTRRGRVRTAHS